MCFVRLISSAKTAVLMFILLWMFCSVRDEFLKSPGSERTTRVGKKMFTTQVLNVQMLFVSKPDTSLTLMHTPDGFLQ